MIWRSWRTKLPDLDKPILFTSVNKKPSPNNIQFSPGVTEDNDVYENNDLVGQTLWVDGGVEDIPVDGYWCYIHDVIKMDRTIESIQNNLYELSE